jgi:hypothetical protein
MTQQFHEGQDVEVAEIRGDPRSFRVLRKAKIVRRAFSYIGCSKKEDFEQWQVQFPDGSRGVFDAAHIRALRRHVQITTLERQLEP